MSPDFRLNPSLVHYRLSGLLFKGDMVSKVPDEMAIPNPDEWFRMFVSAYDKELKRGRGDLNHAYRRAKVRRHLGTERRYFDSGESPEWTSVLSVLLARLAKQVGFRQEWEWTVGRKRRRRIDLVWHPATRDGPICVLIEHESQWRNESAARRLWARSEKIAPHALRVLITYPETIHKPRTPRDWPVIRKEVLVGLGSRVPSDGDFLVCLGPEDWSRSTKWRGYLWMGHKKFRELE